MKKITLLIICIFIIISCGRKAPPTYEGQDEKSKVNYYNNLKVRV